MRKRHFIIMLSFLFSCTPNQIEIGDSLSRSDVERIKDLNLLGENEQIFKFYSEFKKKNAGNFFTNKRIATYWIDERSKEKDETYFAYYKDIKSIDTVYIAGATYSPYMLITKVDSTQFKVSVNGSKGEIKAFFEDAIAKWEEEKK